MFISKMLRFIVIFGDVCHRTRRVFFIYFFMTAYHKFSYLEYMCHLLYRIITSKHFIRNLDDIPRNIHFHLEIRIFCFNLIATFHLTSQTVLGLAHKSKLYLKNVTFHETVLIHTLSQNCESCSEIFDVFFSIFHYFSSIVTFFVEFFCR